jgi:glutamyl-tRNA reductase
MTPLPPHLIMLGIHQRTAPLAQRERFVFAAPDLPQALALLRTCVEEALILTTCNRVEVYATVDDPRGGLETLQAFLAAWHGEAVDQVRQLFAPREGEAAVRHLFGLAAGLDSMVVGEDQIVAQLKHAYGTAREASTAGKILNRLVNSALAASKHVRTQTGVGSYPISVVSVALELVGQARGKLANQRWLIVGAGHIAELALKHLHKAAAPAVTITSRTFAHAHVLAERYSAHARPLDALPHLLGESDVVICAIAAPQPVIRAQDLQLASGQGRLFVDLSVPRAIESSIALRGGGDQLVDLDTLHGRSSHNRSARDGEVAHAEALLEDHVRTFCAWLDEQAVTPTIRALRAKAEAIRDEAVQRALARLPDLSPREQAAVRYLGTAIINKLLHDPLRALKDPEHGRDLADALTEAFDLEEIFP